MVFGLLVTLENNVLFLWILVIIVIGSVVGMLVFLVNLREFGKDLRII